MLIDLSLPKFNSEAREGMKSLLLEGNGSYYIVLAMLLNFLVGPGEFSQLPGPR